MTSREGGKRRGRTIAAWLAGIVVVLAALYSAGWYFAADWLVGRAGTLGAGSERTSGTATCADASAHGFPFSIGISCAALSYEDPRDGVSVRTGSLESSAQVYRPAHITASLAGPAHIESRDGPALLVTWDKLTGNLGLATPVPSTVAVQGRSVRLFLDGAEEAAADVQATRVEVHPEGRNIEMAAGFDGLALSPRLTGTGDLPPLSGTADLSLTDGVAMLAARPKDLRGSAGVVRHLTLSLGDKAGVTLSGPVAVGKNGLVDATLSVVIHDPAELSRLLGKALPQWRDQIDSVLSGFAALGDEPSIPLRIAAGKVWLGFLPVGEIPPL